MMTFSPVSKTVGQIYKVSDLVVNFNVMVFLISFVLFNFGSVQALEHSMAKTFKLCAVSMVLGSWARWLVIEKTDNFVYLTVC